MPALFNVFGLEKPLLKIVIFTAYACNISINILNFNNPLDASPFIRIEVLPLFGRRVDEEQAGNVSRTLAHTVRAM